MMPGGRQDRARSLSERVYGVLLAAYPGAFRREYGPHMAQVFGDLCRKERERAGQVGLFLLWARTVPDLLRTAASERTLTTPDDNLVIPIVGSPRMVRWGGAAAILGAAFSLVATALGVLNVTYLKEPIFNVLWAYQNGGSGYSPFTVFLHPIVSEVLGTLSWVLLATAFIGLYALVARRSGRMARLGGILMCGGFAMLVTFATSNAVRMAEIFGGRLGQIGTDPLLFVADLAVPAFLIGALLLSFAVARTRALGSWSALPLVLLFVGTVLRMVLIRSGLPVQDLPQAVREGTAILLIVHSPTLLTNAGWVLLGCVMWRRSGEVGAKGGTTIPQVRAAEE